MNFENILDLSKIIKYRKEDKIRRFRLIANDGREICLKCRYAYDLTDSYFCNCIFPKRNNFSNSRRTEVLSSCNRYEIKRKYKKYID